MLLECSSNKHVCLLFQQGLIIYLWFVQNVLEMVKINQSGWSVNLLFDFTQGTSRKPLFLGCCELLAPTVSPACVPIMISSVDFCFSLTLCFSIPLLSSQTRAGRNLADCERRVQNHHVLFMRANMLQLQRVVAAAMGLIEFQRFWLMPCCICGGELLLH